MRNRSTAALSTLVLLLIGLLSTAAPAQADTPNCVSRAEYRSIQNGWSKGVVASVFDINGRRASVGDPYQARVYDDCWRASKTTGNVSVFYKYRSGAWRVVDKTTDFWHP
jgi:hypothetical protein